MDIQSFIQSGLLEAYVLGQCSAEERTQVERMAAEHAEIRAELNSIEVSLEAYATAHSVPPPDWMKARILERISLEKPDNPPTEVPGKGSGRFALRLFQILAFLLAAMCSFLFLKQKDMGRDNQEFRFRADSLTHALVACNQDGLKPDAIAELLCDPATQHILISDGKTINTIVYYNERLKKMAYDPYGLPEPKPGKYYQFWAIVADKPVNMGMKSSSLCESMHAVEKVQAFAISEENNPEGNATPSTVLAIKPLG